MAIVNLRGVICQVSNYLYFMNILFFVVTKKLVSAVGAIIRDY
jgi:hypothetical protein